MLQSDRILHQPIKQKKFKNGRRANLSHRLLPERPSFASVTDDIKIKMSSGQYHQIKSQKLSMLELIKAKQKKWMNSSIDPYQEVSKHNESQTEAQTRNTLTIPSVHRNIPSHIFEFKPHARSFSSIGRHFETQPQTCDKCKDKLPSVPNPIDASLNQYLDQSHITGLINRISDGLGIAKPVNQKQIHDHLRDQQVQIEF